MRGYKSFIDDNSRWEGFELRDGDIVVCSPSKSGTTWMQTCCALLVFGSPDAFPGGIGDFSPWLDMNLRPKDEVHARYKKQTHRRIIKTHTPLDGIPIDDRVTYVTCCRDPRDVAVSMSDHIANMDMEKTFELRAGAVGMDDLDPNDMPAPPSDDPAERYWSELMAEGEVSTGAATDVRSVLNHHQQSWDRRHLPNVLRFHYADLLVDLEGQMRRLADGLGVTIDEGRFADQVAAADFDAMKSRATESVPEGDLPMWGDHGEFFKAGGMNRWAGLLTEERLAEYERTVAELVEPDLADWIHHGSHLS